MNVHECKRCRSHGSVIRHNKKIVIIECPKCQYRWQAESKICPECEGYNGFTVDGMCLPCYRGYKSW